MKPAEMITWCTVQTKTNQYNAFLSFDNSQRDEIQLWRKNEKKPNKDLNTLLKTQTRRKHNALLLSCQSIVILMQVSTKAPHLNHLIMSSSSKAWKLDSNASGTSLAVVHETSTPPLDVIVAKNMHQNCYSEWKKPGDCTKESKANKTENYHVLKPISRGQPYIHN